MDMNEILRRAVEQEASDILVTIGSPPVFRIDGELRPQAHYSVLAPSDTELLVSQIITDKQRKELDETYELDCSYFIYGLSRFRVNVYFRNGGMAAAIRTIPSKVPTLEELGLPPVVRELTQEKNGLILVTGPTGSGKSTTLAAMIDLINKTQRKHVITIEDPIEFVYEHDRAIVDQRELHSHTLSFASALKHVVRQTPDVVLVGEMRDLETIALAVTISETGHLVFGTLHTMSAAETIDRIVDVFPPNQQQQIRMQLSGSLRAVISQILIPRKVGGRVAAREIMIADEAIASLIRAGKTHQLYSEIETGSSEGMITLEADVARLLAREIITYETAMAAVNDEKTFLALIDRRSGYQAEHQMKFGPAGPDEYRKPDRPAQQSKREKGSWWKRS